MVDSAVAFKCDSYRFQFLPIRYVDIGKVHLRRAWYVNVSAGGRAVYSGGTVFLIYSCN